MHGQEAGGSVHLLDADLGSADGSLKSKSGPSTLPTAPPSTASMHTPQAELDGVDRGLDGGLCEALLLQPLQLRQDELLHLARVLILHALQQCNGRNSFFVISQPGEDTGCSSLPVSSSLPCEDDDMAAVRLRGFDPSRSRAGWCSSSSTAFYPCFCPTPMQTKFQEATSTHLQAQGEDGLAQLVLHASADDALAQAAVVQRLAQRAGRRAQHEVVEEAQGLAVEGTRKGRVGMAGGCRNDECP